MCIHVIYSARSCTFRAPSNTFSGNLSLSLSPRLASTSINHKLGHYVMYLASSRAAEVHRTRLASCISTSALCLVCLGVLTEIFIYTFIFEVKFLTVATRPSQFYLPLPVFSFFIVIVIAIISFFFFKPSSHSSQVTQSDIIVVSRSLSIRKRVTWTNSRLYRSDPRKKSNGKRRCPEFSFPSYVLESNFHFLMVAFKTGNLGRTKRSEDYFTYGLIVEVLLIYNGA